MLTARESPIARAETSAQLPRPQPARQYPYGRTEPAAVFPAGLPPLQASPGSPASFSGGFLEADYLPLPWLMTIMRWDAVPIADLIKRDQPPLAPISDVRVAFHATRNHLRPGTVSSFANIKVSFEYGSGRQLSTPDYGRH